MCVAVVADIEHLVRAARIQSGHGGVDSRALRTGCGAAVTNSVANEVTHPHRPIGGSSESTENQAGRRESDFEPIDHLRDDR